MTRLSDYLDANLLDVAPTPCQVVRRKGARQIGPFPGRRYGSVIVYELVLPDEFVFPPGVPPTETVHLLLEFGVCVSRPQWLYRTRPDGTRSPGLGAQSYVDLLRVTDGGDTVVCDDFFIDAIIEPDFATWHQLDLHEFADALTGGQMTFDQAADGLRRWQNFLQMMGFGDPR